MKYMHIWIYLILKHGCSDFCFQWCWFSHDYFTHYTLHFFFFFLNTSQIFICNSTSWNTHSNFFEFKYNMFFVSPRWDTATKMDELTCPTAGRNVILYMIFIVLFYWSYLARLMEHFLNQFYWSHERLFRKTWKVIGPRHHAMAT